MSWLLRWKVAVPLALAVLLAIGIAPLAMAVMLSPARAASTASGSGSGLKPGAVPPQYERVVLAAGKLCPALTPAVLAAQYGYESGWNERAVSPAGAQGLAQFMPGTWVTYGVDANEDGTADPFNPVDALWSGAVYDCALAQETDNTTRSMLAAYNAGPAAVAAGLGYADHVISVAKTIEVQLATPDLGGVPAPGPGGCMLPLAHYTITGTFGQVRPGHLHAGLDLSAPYGTPVFSPCAGVVTYAGEASGYGNYICVAHSAAVTTCHGHEQEVLVRVGQRVAAGTVLGKVGGVGQGDATGPHDHWEVRTGLWGTPSDPVAWAHSVGLNP